MSKNKPKDKKTTNDQGTNLQQTVQQQKRQILQQNFTIKRLQDRISRMTEQNHKIVNNHEDMKKKYEQKIDNQRIYLENHQNTIQTLNNKVHSLQIIKLEQQSAIKTLENHVEFQSKTRHKQMDEYKKLVSTEMSVLQNQLKQYNHYMQQRDNVFEQRTSLKRSLQDEKQTKMRQLADKQRQKVQVTDRLKDEMLTQIRDMKTKLLSLKKQQLTTTTRLAVLQNHQLTGQLEFQSKQTQKLLFENQKLQKKITNLQKDVDIHKQVEEQLAKRSHLSKGIIKKLTTKISSLQQQLQKYKQGISQKVSNSNPQSIINQDIHNNSDAQKQQQIISMLDKTLQQKQKNYLKLKSQYHILQNQNIMLNKKIKDYQKKSNQLAYMLTKYYEDVLAGNIQLKLNEQDDYVLDIKGFKQKPVQEWNTEDCRFIVNILLNQLKNNINRHNLGIPTINKSQILVVNDDQQSKFPVISNTEHSLIRRQPRKSKQIPSSLAPKLVGSNIKQWGRTVHSNSVSNLISKKYKY